MAELIANYWPILLAAFLIGLAVAWFAFVASRKTSVQTDKKDVLDEGAAPAARNQALIDAPAGDAPQVPQQEPSPEPVSANTNGGDDLTQIKGLGPKIATMLNAMGVNRIGQIAEWDDAEIDRIDAQLGRFSGRIRRDNWVEQAKLLSSGEDANFAGKFGNNG